MWGKSRTSSGHRSEVTEDAVWPKQVPVGPVVFDPSLRTAGELARERAPRPAPTPTAPTHTAPSHAA